MLEHVPRIADSPNELLLQAGHVALSPSRSQIDNVTCRHPKLPLIKPFNYHRRLVPARNQIVKLPKNIRRQQSTIDSNKIDRIKMLSSSSTCSNESMILVGERLARMASRTKRLRFNEALNWFEIELITIIYWSAGFRRGDKCSIYGLQMNGNRMS